MDKLNALLRYIGNFWGPQGLSRELQRYCEQEGIDPWSLLDAERKAREAHKPAVPLAEESSDCGVDGLRSAMG